MYLVTHLWTLLQIKKWVHTPAKLALKENEEDELCQKQKHWKCDKLTVWLVTTTSDRHSFPVLFREHSVCVPTYKNWTWLVMSLHTGQTLICAMGKAAVLLRVSVVPLATSCVQTSLLNEGRGSNRSTQKQKQSTQAGDVWSAQLIIH